MTHGVLNLVKNVVHKKGIRRPVIPLDNLYAFTVEGFDTCSRFADGCQ